MIEVQTVPDNYLYSIWPLVEPMLDKALLVSQNDYDIRHLKLYVTSKAQTLLVAVEDNKIVGAATISLLNYPNYRVATIVAMGGRAIVKPEVFEQVVQWAKAQGATKIRAAARGAQARLYRQKAGLDTTMYVIEKLI
jgi:hypothetical protein